jgi:hypothetical protein
MIVLVALKGVCKATIQINYLKLWKTKKYIVSLY